MCRACNTKRCKKYRKTGKGRERIYEAVYKSIKKLSDRQNARRKLRYHLKKGFILKPDYCERCGLETKLEAHHQDYSLALDVIWLCKNCHCEADKVKCK